MTAACSPGSSFPLDRRDQELGAQLRGQRRRYRARGAPARDRPRARAIDQGLSRATTKNVKVAKVCEDFGLRRQYSVFFCRLAAVDMVRLKSRLYDVINLDQIRFCLFRCVRRCASAIEALGTTDRGA